MLWYLAVSPKTSRPNWKSEKRMPVANAAKMPPFILEILVKEWKARSGISCLGFEISLRHRPRLWPKMGFVPLGWWSPLGRSCGRSFEESDGRQSVGQ